MIGTKEVCYGNTKALKSKKDGKDEKTVEYEWPTKEIFDTKQDAENYEIKEMKTLHNDKGTPKML